MKTLYYYQEDAVKAINEYLRDSDGNPCVCIPTGGGKSLVIAELIRRWKAASPELRCIVLQHRKELVLQNSAELLEEDPTADVGIFSAGLHRKELEHTITYAGIDSVYHRYADFGNVSVVIVDEAHRIPIKGDGKYRTFINGLKSINPKLRVVGLTATPFRLDSTSICDPAYILTKLVYNTDTVRLIKEGYLSKLDSVLGAAMPDTHGIHKVNGDYNQKELGKRVGEDSLVHKTVADALTILNKRTRKCVIWFCVDIEHCEKVSAELTRLGERCAYITGNTSAKDREQMTLDFKNGVYRHLLNVNVFTEGFNVKQVDALCLLRPTMSKGLYWQMVGRGLRTHPDKDYCAVLDYGHCIADHGSLADDTPVNMEHISCPECRSYFPSALGKCPHCGYELPKKVVERKEGPATGGFNTVRRMHDDSCSNIDIMGERPIRMTISDVMVSKHSKPGKPPSLRVMYRCGLTPVCEWICLEHDNFPKRVAQTWWRLVIGTPCPATVDEALSSGPLSPRIMASVKSIDVVRKGPYLTIKGRTLKDGRYICSSYTLR